jgi:UDP-GlcNAc:undecaprenyl-phosphate/decaprenyl-phosphate GlcNAc-1-phosphate transferase
VSGTGLRSAAVAAAVARLTYAALGQRPPAGRHAWTRTNHRGEPITLLEGPAVAVGGLAGALAATGLEPRERIAMAVAGAGAAVFGGYDDLAGDSASKGFRGHLGALRHGELTTGAVKIVGIGATGLAAALIASRGSAGRGSGGRGPAGRQSSGRAAGPLAAADTLIDAGLVAGLANLMNLFDLRPGRAVKVAAGTGALLAALPGTAGEASAAPVAAAVAMLPEDLGERSMLGDAGANAIGAMLGVAATRLPRTARLGLLTAVAGLTAASEKVSFTAVIQRTGPLRWLDMLGRRPPAPAPDTPAPAGDQGAAGAGTAGDRAGRSELAAADDSAGAAAGLR